MRWSWLICVALAGCEPSFPSLDVSVAAARSGAALKGAVVAVACPLPALGGAARTDPRGRAHVEVNLDELAPCTVTVSHPDFEAVQLVDVDVCPAGGSCDAIAVELDEAVRP